jgi:hypothetical protein
VVDLRMPTTASAYDCPTGRELRRVLGIVSEQELADALGVTVSTLASWRGKNYGPAASHLGKGVFYDIAQIRNWIELAANDGWMDDFTAE